MPIYSRSNNNNDDNNFKSQTFFLFLILIIFPYTVSSLGSSWQLLLNNVGIPAMHMQLLHNDRVIMFDRTIFGPSNITLPPTKCRPDPRDDKSLETDCTAHSVEYNIKTNSVRPLKLSSDTWCSSGSVLSDGRLVQTGGFADGARVVRTFNPNCNNNNNFCDWEEIPSGLIKSTWYATDHILPDGSAIIVGGTSMFNYSATNYEFFPKNPSTSSLIDFPFLRETREFEPAENNLYPFVFLNVDGNLFVFADNRAILLNYKTNVVLRTYPVVPGGDPRNYPSTGSAVLLPLKNLELGDQAEAEVLICGGARREAYGMAADEGRFLAGLNTCARMKITDPNPTWVIETMPMPRVMSDMVVLPNGNVLIINGAKSGVAGWELGRDPILSPVIYHPDNMFGSRFVVTNPSTIPRMYHSCAILLRDGRVLVGGSNPHQFNNFTNVLFPTELRLEAFSPPYLDPNLSSIRPIITTLESNTQMEYGKTIKLKVTIKGLVNLDAIKVTMVRPPFNTHSFSMSQRLLVLTRTNVLKPSIRGRFAIRVRAPGSGNIAPPGYYMLFVVHQNVPSQGIWVRIGFT